jgi:DNA-binding NarL/FixJ family response regulator
MDSSSKGSQVRLAELVAAIWLGIDLGFGQPMEHVLRQCLIALRLAERIGLAESQRAAVYYTALLINVGCHSDAHEQEQAAAELRAEVKAGGLDAAAVEAVLGAAGHRVQRRRDGPAGLTWREVEVLRLLARGYSNKDIAQRLFISPKTAGNHIDHIYTKIDASTRASAAFFAMHQGLLPEEEFT